MARLIKWGTKVGIVGATVYYTNEVGLWGDSSNTEQLYRDMITTVYPLLEDVPVEIPEIPRAGDISRAIVDGWNSGVFHSANFIAHLPTHVADAGAKVSQWIQEQTNPPAPSS